MANAAPSTRPIAVLGEAVRSLEAAVVACQAAAKKQPVHQLRTWTRRGEAQLELIALLPEAPPHEAQRKEALDLLKKLRRAAGRVRDLDVERDLVGGVAARVRSSSAAARSIRDEAGSLRRKLARDREEEAAAR